MADIINVEILPDGSLKIETDKVSMPNHAGAEALLRDMTTAMGGEAVRKRKVSVNKAVGHTHDGHYHEH